ncbi:hypothetical protein [Fusobacterium hominis]|uniref:Uncharacterized protein n=1 Tax=Fusobacterium hominis TaxID=2764326 RepID=A0A7G9GXK5_9FUSO|nr:hypothetical protein [Fusobacterium hominis]QNM15537.1 hypothetical protein H9Q81_01465 [Fusobacterium hominis]
MEEKKTTYTEAQKRANEKYLKNNPLEQKRRNIRSMKSHCKRYILECNDEEFEDVLAWIEERKK